jgi:glutamate-1-semialdehyde 2,1-aminomutase
MEVFSTDQGRPKVSHGGTYNANPVTMVAGHAAMALMTPDEFARLDRLGERMRAGLAECLKLAGHDGQVKGQGSLCLLSLCDRPILGYRDLAYAARFAEAQAAVHRDLLNHGVFTSPPLLFTLSTAMGEAEVDVALEQVLAALKRL